MSRGDVGANFPARSHFLRKMNATGVFFATFVLLLNNKVYSVKRASALRPECELTMLYVLRNGDGKSSAKNSEVFQCSIVSRTFEWSINCFEIKFRF